MLTYENTMGLIKQNLKKFLNHQKQQNLEKSTSWILVKYVEIYFQSHRTFISYSAKSNNFFKKKEPK